MFGSGLVEQVVALVEGDPVGILGEKRPRRVVINLNAISPKF
jgi:hypothetical protein